MILKIKNLIKKEPVFCISALCALITMFFVTPDKAYIEYIDLRVLCILMCLMAVVAGFKSIGIFDVLTNSILNRIKSGKALAVTLVMLPFLSSMLITNDVALIIFIPFTITLMNELSLRKETVPLIVLQTVAANLGSMATPVGNPQNLFLYSVYGISIKNFFYTMLPLTAISFVFLTLFALPVFPKKLSAVTLPEKETPKKTDIIIFAGLFVLSLLTVFRAVPFEIATIITIIVLLISYRNLFREIDFMLLLTFICFFIISGNLGRIDAVRNFLQNLLEKNTLLTSVGASQVISNVPAAVLLSDYTNNWKDILCGVNIGGLGTPIASLASLITLKLYLKTPKANILKFLGIFTLVNIAGLVILVSFKLFI